MGACGVGKSTIARLLAAAGYRVGQPAQEHSGVPDMWQRLTRPDVLVYLEASLETLQSHRPASEWTAARLAEARYRLRHAERHADLRLSVDGCSAEDTARQVLEYLDQRFPGAV